MKLWNSPAFRRNLSKKCEVTVMEQAYHQITAESTFRESMRLWEKARHDEASALSHAQDEGFIEGFIEGFVDGFIGNMAEGCIESVAESFAKNMEESLAKVMAERRAKILKKNLAEGMAKAAQKLKAIGFSDEQIQIVTRLQS